VSHAVVETVRLAPGGDAVGREVEGAHAGRVTFVPLAAPGERVRVRLTRQKPRAAWADLVSVERASPARVSAPCPLFGSCGGCQWQHVARPAQLAAKGAIVARALAGPIDGVIAASADYGYRDRARLTVGRGGALGFLARRSHDVVDVAACPLLGPELQAALPAVRAAARAAQLPAGAAVHVQAGGDGVAANVRDGAGRLMAEVDVAEPGSPPLRAPAGAFAQVGRVANRALVRAVLDAVGPAPGRVIELYAGSGNFTRHLVALSDDVNAADGDAGAVARGRINAPAARWHVGPVARSSPAPDVVVLDPPRVGADAAALALAAAALRRIVYVSCDPQTLARDARQLGAAGFRLVGAVALDLMPQTAHVEVVATFER